MHMIHSYQMNIINGQLFFFPQILDIEKILKLEIEDPLIGPFMADFMYEIATDEFSKRNQVIISFGVSKSTASSKNALLET